MNNTETTQQERFRYMREEILNISQQKLADALGIKQQTVADIESGRKQKIDTEILYILMKEYLINTEWLLFGVGNVNKICDAEEIEKQLENIVSIPFYSAKAAAGSGVDMPEYTEKDVLHFDSRWIKNILGINPNNAVIIQAEGDSMLPDIREGDLLMLDTSYVEPQNGKTFVIQIDNQLVVKVVMQDWDGSIKLISNNPKYPPRILNEHENASIVGKVVWNGSKENI